MQIASYAGMPASHTAQAQHTQEATEGPGPDHDGDSDNASGVSSSPTQSLTSPGVGNTIDVSA